MSSGEPRRWYPEGKPRNDAGCLFLGDVSGEACAPTGPAVYGPTGPAVTALLVAMERIRSDALAKREMRDEERLVRQWTSDKDGPEGNLFFNALLFAADPAGSVAAAASGKDPVDSLASNIVAAAMSEEGIWASVASSWPSVAEARPVRSGRSTTGSASLAGGVVPIQERKPPPPAAGVRGLRSVESPGCSRAGEMVAEGARVLRQATPAGAAKIISGIGTTSADKSLVAKVRLAACVACNALGVGLVLCAEDGSPVPVILNRRLDRVVWIPSDPWASPETVIPDVAMARVSRWCSRANATSPVVDIRAALVAAGVPRPHPRAKLRMLESLKDSLARRIDTRACFGGSPSTTE